ncbi:acyl-CoA dehydrogenase family protein [Niallia oryzisoli]|uniref:Medium-chain specific acyl-CoA dehydrogenase, mitochondrial n=1 Tax=Niallia oryzisoli TaxID=1737571 RepID=A0ABZ2C704_9BACI
MDFRLTEEQRMVQKTIRDFVNKELIPLEMDVLKNEREGRPGLSKEKLKELQLKAKKAGFWGINTPEEYGGANLDPITSAIITMEQYRTFVPFEFGGHANNILYACNEEQKQKYLVPVIEGDKVPCFALTEPSGGSDPQMNTTAVKDGDYYILNGEKVFITRGMEADFAIVFASTDKSKGRSGGVTAFLVDREMGFKSEPIQTMGGTWEPAQLIFDNVRVPKENIIGEEGKGFKYAMMFINHNRGWVIPARSVGAAERLLEMCIDYANTRVTFGKPIGTNQAIQWMIADSQTEIEAAKWIMFRAAWMADQEGSWNSDKNDSIKFRHQASMAKLYGTNMVNRVVDRAIQIHGGMGFTKEFPIERWYRNLRVWRVYEGSDEMLRRTIAKHLLDEQIKPSELMPSIKDSVVYQ